MITETSSAMNQQKRSYLELYTPDFYIERIDDDHVWIAVGMVLIQMDIDGLLVNGITGEYNPGAERWLEGVRDSNPRRYYSFISNKHHTEENVARAKRIRDHYSNIVGEEIHLEMLAGRDKKPSRVGFERSVRAHGLESANPRTIGMFGDQPSDCAGAKKLGHTTCLVKPFGKQELVTRIFKGPKNLLLTRVLVRPRFAEPR